MKHNNLIKIFLVLVMGEALVWFGMSSYKQGAVEFNEQARGAFEKALEKELAKREVKDSLLNIVSWIDASGIGEIPKTVWINKGSGPVEYKMSAERHQQNVTKDVETRLSHSMALEKNPLIPDTLNAIWQQMLKESHLTGRTALRITTTDMGTNTTSLSTSDYARFASLDSLFVCTLGYCCEVEIMGATDGSWRSVFIRSVGIRLLLLLAVCVFVYLFVGYLMRKLHRSPVVEEVIKTQLVKELPKTGERIYQIREELVLYADRMLLVADEQEIAFTLQPCVLFELLLNADDYELSDAAIMAQLWPDNSGTAERLSQVVKRLRAPLKVQSVIKVKRMSSVSYKLVISMAPEQN